MTQEIYNQISELLTKPHTNQNATTLINLYKKQNNKLNVGCLCKQANIDRAYHIIQNWFNTITNDQIN